AYLVTERSSEIDLTEQEMLAIPELLNCTRWKEINDLISGVLPDITAAPAPVALPQPESPVPASAEVVVPPPPPAFWQRARGTLRTTAGRLAVAMAALALALAMLLLLRPVRVVPVSQPPAPLLVPTSGSAAGGVGAGGG